MNIVMPNATKKLKLEQQDPGLEPKSLDRDSPIPLKNLGNTCYENSIIQCLFSLNMFMDNFERSMMTIRKYVVKSQLETFDCQTLSNEQHEQQQNEDKQQEQSFVEERLQEQPQEQAISSEADNKTITERDVRFRIANAFDNLYKSYTKKRIQIENSNQTKPNLLIKNDTETHQSMFDQSIETSTTGISEFSSNPVPTTTLATSSTSTDLAISQPQHAIPLCKPSITSSEASYQQFHDEKGESIKLDTPLSTTSTTITSNLTPIALMAPSSSVTQNEQSEIEKRLEDLKLAVGERSSQFNSTHQQDASEFFYHVIDSIQEFYQSLDKSNDDDNPVTKAFELELDYLIRCPKCRHQTLTEPEKIRTLPLALPHVNNNTTIDTNETTTTTNNTITIPTNSIDQSNKFIHETNGAPTPPTSDLGLDSPESSTFEEQKNGSNEKENQALNEDEEMRCEDINSNNTTVSSNTMSIAKLDLTDDLENQQNDMLQRHEPKQEIQPQSQPELKSETGMPNKSPPPPQKQYTLNDALNNYFKDDVLECNCSQESCDSKRRTKKCLIRKLPQVLFITLARYSYTGKKNLDEIEPPFELSVPFKENKSPSHSPSAYTRLDDDNSNKYQLVAVVCHLGSSLNAGHYTSYVYNQNNFSWYCCDDDSITKVNEADVKSDATKSGYCFFYAHNSCVNQKPQTVMEQIINSQSNIEKEFTKNQSDIESNNVVDSSVVLTPESSPSPKSSPPSPHTNIQDAIHHDNTCCIDNDIDDWS